MTFQALTLHQSKRLVSIWQRADAHNVSFESLYSGPFNWIPCYTLPWTHHHSFFRNFTPSFIWVFFSVAHVHYKETFSNNFLHLIIKLKTDCLSHSIIWQNSSLPLWGQRRNTSKAFWNNKGWKTLYAPLPGEK